MGGFLAGLKPAKNQAVQHSAFAPASALVAALLACVGRLRRASHPCRRQGRARKRTFKSESLRKQTLEMPQCGMIQSLTQESSQAGIKLTCGISFLYTWVNHNEQFLQPDCEHLNQTALYGCFLTAKTLPPVQTIFCGITRNGA